MSFILRFFFPPTPIDARVEVLRVLLGHLITQDESRRPWLHSDFQVTRLFFDVVLTEFQRELHRQGL